MDGLRLDMNIHPYCKRFGLATVAMKVQDLLNYTTIDPMVQRKLSNAQRKRIAKYLLERELDYIFFGPVTLSLREVSQLTKDEVGLILKHGSKLSILDGQHRIYALAHVNDQLLKEARRTENRLRALRIRQRKEPDNAELNAEAEQLEGLLSELEARRLALMETELAVQMYIGLNEEAERQLFGDINSKILLVSKELGHSFDSADPLNVILQQVVQHNLFLRSAGVESRNNLTAYNRNFTCFSWMYSTASLLLSGTMKPSYELLRKIRKDPSAYTEILHQFFDRMLVMMPEEPGLPRYTSSSRLMQEAIALYAFEYRLASEHTDGQWTECLDILEGFDWSHDNERLIELFGRQDNGRINLVHDKSLRKHHRLIQFFKQLRGDAEPPVDSASLA
jgi:hypothetical protein